MMMVSSLFRLFLFNARMCIARNIQYRVDFLLNTVITFSLSALAPIVQFLIFTKTNGYPGWNLNQIILFQGCLLFWVGLRDLLFADIRYKMNALIQKGGLDRILLSPYPVIGAILAEGFNLSSIGTVISGMVIIIYSLNKIAIEISLIQIVFLVLVFLFGMILYLAVLIFFCSVNILIVFIGRLADVLDKLMKFSEYPVEIFPGLSKLIFVSVFPIAVWIYFPAQVLLNRFNVLNLLFIFIFSIVLFGLSLISWNLSLKKYTSSGG